MSELTVEIKDGEVLRIGDACVTLVYKSGRKARLRISAPKTTIIETPASKARMSALQDKERQHG